MGDDETTSGVDPRPPGASLRHLPDPRRWTPLGRFIGCAVALYVVLVLFGVSTSSMGHPLLRQDPAHPTGVELGVPQPIRSDEFLTDTPLVLGRAASGRAFDTNPLTEEPGLNQQLPTGPASALTFFDGTLFRATGVIPDAMLFAMRWWLPVLLLFVFAPLWFREITGRARFGVLCAALVFFAPSNTWWSYRATAILGFVFAACWCAMACARRLQNRRWVPAAALALAAGVGLARFPTNYQPFAIVAGIPVVAVTAVVLLRRTGLRPRVRIATVAIVGLVALALFLGSVAENWASLTAALETDYPGRRRLTGGGANEGWMLFSAPALGSLITPEPIAPVTNASEISTAFTVTALWAGVLLTSRRLRGAMDRWAVWVASAITVFWLAWMILPWGELGRALPVVNLVDPRRAMAMVGMAAAVAACLVLSWWRPPGSWRVPAAAGALVAVATAWGALSLRATHYPDLPVATIVISVALSGACVAAITRFPERSWPLVLTAVCLVALAIRVNPVIVGLGDLRSTPTAEAMIDHGAAARAEGTAWASDFLGFDSLMMATATPAVSGRQQSGPEREMWRRLDRSGAHEAAWNRGGTYIWLQWGTGRTITFANPSPDVVVVTVAPCELARRIPLVTTIASTRPLTEACLTPQGVLPWAGRPMYVYGTAARSPAGGGR